MSVVRSAMLLAALAAGIAFTSPALGTGSEGFVSCVRGNLGALVSTPWIQDPTQSHETQKLVEWALSLSPEERAKALRDLGTLVPSGSSLRLVLQLALYDENTWHWYLDYIFRNPTGYEFYHSLVPVLNQMPEDLKRSLYRRIGPAYPTLSKDKLVPGSNPPRFLVNGPRRTVDALLSHTLNPSELITSQLLSGRSPQEALDAYFKLQRKLIFGESEIGNYDADTVLAVAREIQAALRSDAVGPAYRGTAVVMAGSLPNGRASLATSDIDMAFTAQSMPIGQQRRILDEINRRVPAALGGKHGKVGLHAGEFTSKGSFRDRALPFYAMVNPIELRIDRDRIELLVFPSISSNSDEVYDGRRLYRPGIVLPLEGPPSPRAFFPRELGLGREAEKRVQRAVESVPGWKNTVPLRVLELDGGATHRSFRVLHPNGSEVLVRLPRGPVSPGAIAQEAAASRAAAEKGVSPRLLHSDDRNGILVFEYLRGRHPTDLELRQPRQLEGLGHLLRKSHQAAPESLARFDPFGRIRGFRREAEMLGFRFDPELTKLLAEAERVEKALPPPRVPARLHNDLHPGALIATPDDSLRLVGWGDAAAGDPLHDLGNLAAHLDLDPTQSRRLLQSYFGRSDEADFARLQLARLVSDLRNATRLIRDSRMPDANPAAWQSAELLLKRARALAADPDFERWLQLARSPEARTPGP